MFRNLFLLLGILTLSGCSAMQTAVQYKDLDITTTTERPVFLRHHPQKLFLSLDNPVSEFSTLRGKLEDRYRNQGGYDIVESEADADVLLYIRIGDRQHGKISARAVQGHRDMTASGGALAGAAAGFISGPTDPVSAVVGAVAGAAAGAVGDITINSLVHLGILDLQADILAREKLPAKIAAEQKTVEDPYRESDSRITVRAKQANIKWEEAAEPIEEALAGELGRILPPCK
jgi:hypothetical protein